MSITRQGINFWKALFTGDILHYYSLSQISVEQGEMIHYANYDMVLNLLISLWQLPLFILEKIIGGNILQFYIAKVYSKLYLIILVWWTGKVLQKIGKQMNYDDESLDNLFLMYISGITIFTTAGVVGQIDLFGILFILYALYYLLCDKKKLFMLFFILAVQCKFFALFILTPVILLQEKKIWKCCIEVVIPLLVTVIIALPFKLADPLGVAGKGSRLSEMVEYMLESKIYFLGYTIPIIFITYIAVCIIAYYLEISEEKGNWYIYFAYLGCLVLFLPMKTYPYWFIYFLPFTCLFFFINTKKRKRKLFIETVCSWALAVGYILNSYWCFSAFGVMWVSKVFQTERDFIALSNIWDKFGHASYYMAWTITYAPYVILLILITIYYNPKVQKKLTCDDKGEDISRGLTIRLIGNFLICNVGLILFLLAQINI